MIDICVLCVNDYNKECRVEGLGFAKSYDGIKQYGSIENFFESKLQNNRKLEKSKAKKKPKLFQVPEGFDYKAIRKIFSDYAFRTTIPQEFKDGNPFKFDMKRATYFFYIHDMNIHITELMKWAQILEGKEYDEAEIDYFLNEAKESHTNVSAPSTINVSTVESVYSNAENDECIFTLANDNETKCDVIDDEIL